MTQATVLAAFDAAMVVARSAVAVAAADPSAPPVTPPPVVDPNSVVDAMGTWTLAPGTGNRRAVLLNGAGYLGGMGQSLALDSVTNHMKLFDGSDWWAVVNGAWVGTSPPPAVVPPVTPTGTSSFSIGGAGYSTLAAAMTALVDGQTLDIAPGDYPSDCGCSNANGITIRCATEAVFHAAAVGKSTFVLGGNNVTLQGLSGVGIMNGSGNGGLIRFEGANLTGDRIRVDGCQTGILTGNAHADGVIRFTNLSGTGNGTPGDGQSHAVYVGECAELHISWASLSDTIVGHLVKSRAGATYLTNCKLDKGRASRCVDACLGGVLVIDGTSQLINSTVSQNYELIGYGAELPRDSTGMWGIAKYAVNTFTVAPTVKYFGRDPRDHYVKDTYRGFIFLQPTVYDDQHQDFPMPTPAPIPAPAAGTVVPLVRDASGNVPDSWWAALPKGQWLHITGVPHLIDLKPAIDPRFVELGTGTATGNLYPLTDAWSGGAFSDLRGVFQGSGGGHHDSNNNMVYEFDFKTLTMRIAHQPSLMTAADFAAASLAWGAGNDMAFRAGVPGDATTPDGMPGVLHSYNNLCFDEFGNLWTASITHNFKLDSSGVMTKQGAANSVNYDSGQVYYNGCIYRAGQRNNDFIVAKYVIATGVETIFRNGLYFDAAGPNWVDDLGRWWWYGEQWIDLNSPTLAGHLVQPADRLGIAPRDQRPFDSNGSSLWLQSKRRGYFMDKSVPRGRLYECNVDGPLPVWTKLADGVPDMPNNNLNYGRFFAIQKYGALVLIPSDISTGSGDLRVFVP